jgi:hypothetical protein
MASVEKELQVGQQNIRFDREATVALYRDTITVPGADRCICISCKNFAAQRDKAYPEEFLHLLAELGINPLREWEAFDYDSGLEKKRGHLYGGWFLFSGELIGGAEERPKTEQPTFAHWFTTSFPRGTLPRDAKLCAVEFLARLPWILPAVS